MSAKKSVSSHPPGSDEHLTKAKEHAQTAGEELSAAAATKATEVFQDIKAKTQDRSQELWEEIQKAPVFEDASRLLKEKPLKALLITFGLGVVVGLTLRR